MKSYKLQKKKKNNKNFTNEVKGIVIFSFAVLISLSLYTSGTVGIFERLIKNFLLGFFGSPAYLFPIALVIWSFFIIFNSNSEIFNNKIIYIAILILVISSMLQLSRLNNIEYDIKNLNFTEAMIMSYDESKLGSIFSGGLVGGFIGFFLSIIFQYMGTIVILISTSIILLVKITDVSIVQITNALKEVIQYLFNFGKKSSIKFIQDCKKRRKKKRPVKIEVNGLDDKKNVGLKFERNLDEAKNDNNIKLMIPEFKSNILKKAKRNNKKNNENEKNNEIDSEEKIEEIVEQIKIEDNNYKNNDDNYIFPSIDLLIKQKKDKKNIQEMKEMVSKRGIKLEETLRSFKIEAEVKNASCGPAVTRYEVRPDAGVKVSRIVGLADDISLRLASHGVRIEAPIPGKALIGIEVPNNEIVPVGLREVIESDEFERFESKLAFAIGKDISGNCVVSDIGKMPHVLIAGATGSGKSVCINSLLISILYKSSPKEVKLIMIDPKVVELGIYNGIQHLLIPVVTEPRKAAGALNWAVTEMTDRYKKFADSGVRDIKGYNQLVREKDSDEVLPQIVIIIDELADLMMVAPNEVEDAVCRLAQMARAAGMHLVIATQRPSVDVITGVIKANIPSRISFAVASQIDSRTILDMGGAEKLLGKGDMLYYPVGEPKPIRIKGAFISDKEVENVVNFVKKQAEPDYDEDVIEEINKEKVGEINKKSDVDRDELLPKAIELVIENKQASVSLIQRKFKVGYARAARIVDQMEDRGIVGKHEGSKPRQVLMTKQKWDEVLMTDGKAKDL
ncbi:MAG: DNA translocase FtsK 4TM domain-containing protein [Clostridiales bacterium]